MRAFVRKAKLKMRSATFFLKEMWNGLKDIITKTILNFRQTSRPITALSVEFFRRLGKSIKEIIAAIIYNPVTWSITFSLTIALLYKLVLQYHIINFILPQRMIDGFPTVQQFINWLGIPYSFLISMALLRAWERADEISNLLRNEAHSIAVLVDSIQMTIENSDIKTTDRKQKLLLSIEDYVNHVENAYDSEYEDLFFKNQGDKLLKKIEFVYRELSELESSATKSDQKLLDVIVARKERIGEAKGRMPAIFWSLLMSTSILWLFLFLSVSFDDPWLGFVLIFGVTFIVSTIIITILLFNEPTSIQWNDISESWKRLRAKIISCKELIGLA